MDLKTSVPQGGQRSLVLLEPEATVRKSTLYYRPSKPSHPKQGQTPLNLTPQTFKPTPSTINETEID